MELGVEVNTVLDYGVKKSVRAKLTDEHSQSSLPFLVMSGKAYGVADLELGTTIIVHWRRARTGIVWDLVKKAMQVGYPIEIESW